MDNQKVCPTDMGFLSPQLSAQDVAEQLGLSVVNVDYTDDDFRNWNNINIFSNEIRPLLQRENPKVDSLKGL